MRFAIYTGDGSAKESAKKLFEVLSGSFEVLEFQTNIPDADFYVFGGGRASEMAVFLGREKLKELNELIRDGKGYIGVCAGAYLAIEGYWTDEYPLDVFVAIRAHHPDVDRWMRGEGWVRVEAFGREWKLWYENGPIFSEGDYEIIGVFLDELNESGSRFPMLGTPAIIRKGRVLLFSPHPELSGKEGEELFMKALEVIL